MRARVIVVFGSLVLAQCSRHGSSDGKEALAGVASVVDGGEHSDEEAHAGLPTRIRLDPSVVTAAKIATEPVVRAVLAPTLDLPGEVSSDPDKTARVSALVEGRVESIRFKEGDGVHKGDALLTIKVPELGKAKAAFAATNAKAQAARANADRLKDLADKRLAANQEVLAAQADADALEAEAKAAEEQLHALGTGATGGTVGSLLTLRAPVDGVVVSRDAIVGQPVNANQTLATIADLTEVWFLGKVFEKNLSQVRIGAPAEITLNAYPKSSFNGSVEYLGKQVDPTARTVMARIRITNRDDLLRLGLFGVAHVGTGEESTRAPVLVIPETAVTEIADKTSVFVKEPDGDYALHEVTLGDRALGKVEVVHGLREGEQVVVAGVFTLKSATLKSTFAGEEE